MGLFSRGGPALAPLTPLPKMKDLPTAHLRHAGRYLGTLVGQERVRSHGLGRAGAARIQLSHHGVDVVRLAGSFRIPADELRSARDTTVFDRSPVDGGALVIRWQHAGELLETGFRLDPGPGELSGSVVGARREWSRAISKMGSKMGPKMGSKMGRTHGE